MTKFLDCVMVVLPEKFRLSAQRMFDMFNGMSKTDAVLLMCKSAMDAASALFDDFVTMYADTEEEREHLKGVLVHCYGSSL
ncbi:uncharacterized protein LOC119395954 isoform X2 [Rhipicephalus sanguineus]|nr:uncharacterized protein LOC119395954 isoform X2 [Rhipicephalus sanguineus]